MFEKDLAYELPVAQNAKLDLTAAVGEGGAHFELFWITVERNTSTDRQLNNTHYEMKILGSQRSKRQTALTTERENIMSVQLLTVF